MKLTPGQTGRLKQAQQLAAEDIEQGINPVEVWNTFKSNTLPITSPEFTELIQATQSMISRGILKTPKQIGSWIEKLPTGE
jgi:hypothetical protein